MAASEKITEEMYPDDVPQLQCSVGPSTMHDPGASNTDDSKIEVDYEIRNFCSMEQIESIEDGDKYDSSDTESTASVGSHTEEKVDSYREDNGETCIEHAVDSSTKGKTKKSRRRKKAKSCVFVGNLPRNANRAEILEHFSKFRESIMHKPMIIRRKIGTQARLTFSSPAAASDAIESLNQSMFKKSSCISVEPWSNSKHKQKHKAIKAIMSSEQSECDGGPSEMTEKKTTVYVYNLPSSVTNNDVRTHFREFGPHIHKLQVIKDSTVEESKEYARILFTSLKAAQTAVVKLHKSCMPQSQERHITVKIRKEKPDKQSMETESAPEQKKLQKASPKEMYPPSSNVQGEHHNGDDTKGVDKRYEYDYTKLESATNMINHTETKVRVCTKKANPSGNGNKQVSLSAVIRPISPCEPSNCVAGVNETADKVTVVFIYNLPSIATDDDVRMHFMEFERHICKVLLIKDSKSKESKQFALVKFTSLEVAKAAVAKLHKLYMPQFQENCLSMRIAKGKQPQIPSKEPVSKPSQHRKGKVPLEEEKDCAAGVNETADKITVVVVYNLPSTATDDDVRMNFIEFEQHIHKILVIKDSKSKESKQFALVKFTSLEAAQTAVAKLNKSYMPQFQKNRLSMRIAKRKQPQPLLKEHVSKPSRQNKKGKAPSDESIQEERTAGYMENGEDISDSELTISSVCWKEKSSKQSISSKLDMKKQPPVQRKRGKSPPPREIEFSHPRTSTQVRDPTEQLIGVSITNVSESVTGDQLMQILNTYGTVIQYTIMHAPEEEDMYKVVVYFGSKEEADNVITKLNDEKLAGKHIHIHPLNESMNSLANFSADTLDTYGVYISEIPKALKLQPCFAKYGSIASLFLNPDNSSAYVSYYRFEDAQAALDMNNREVCGGKLKVKMASNDSTPSTPDNSTPLLSPSLPSSFSMPRETTTSNIPPSFTVQIKHLSPVTTMGNLSRIVEVYGAITSRLHVINGNPRYAFVSYATLEAANAAISCLHNQPLDGSRLKVKLKSAPYHVATPSHLSIPPPTAAVSVPNSSSVIKNVPMSARLYQFLNEQMEFKLREFRSFSGSVSWQNNTLIVTAPSVPILIWFENYVLGQIGEHHIALNNEDWKKLMSMRPDKTNLFQQLMHSFLANDVYIDHDSSSLIVCAVGLKGAVQDVVATVSAELNKEIVVEQIKMMALLKLDPTLKEQAQSTFGALMEGFSVGSTKISFAGSSHAVSQARGWFNSLLKQYTVAGLLCHRDLIPSILDCLSTKLLSVVVCVKYDDGTICYAQCMTMKTVQMNLLVCGREPFVQRAVEILNHPEERIITFETMDALHKLKSQLSCDFSSLSEQHKVYIHESTGPVLTIQSYSKDCIATVESILNQAKLSIERCSVVLQGSKAKIAHLTAAFAQHLDQAKIFFDAIYQVTSVEILYSDNEVRLTGSLKEIKEAEKMIDNSNFLKGFKCEAFEFECHPNFIGQTEKYLKEKFDQHQLGVIVRCYKKISRKASKEDMMMSLTTIFYVEIGSENDVHFAAACEIVKGLKPESRYIQMSKKQFQCLSQATTTRMPDLEATHRIQLELQDIDNVVIIHGLTVTEINAAEDEIGAYVNANIQTSD